MIFKLNVTLQFIAILLKRKISIVRSDCNSQTAHLIHILISGILVLQCFDVTNKNIPNSRSTSPVYRINVEHVPTSTIIPCLIVYLFIIPCHC